MSKLNWYYFDEAEEPVAQTAPTSDPTTGSGIPGLGTQQGQQQPPQQQQQKPEKGLADAPEEDDVEQDPQQPEMPDEEETEKKDFETWRGEFMKLAEKSDTKQMLESIKKWKDREDLEPPQARFVSDNYKILIYRQDANVEKAMKEIRNLIKQDLDKTNPGTTIMQHVTTVVEKIEPLKQVLIKLTGFGGLKAELHRKFLAGILGAVQVGGGNRREDLIFADKGYTVNVSTRFATQFGEISIGRWALKESDPQEFLTNAEMDRLSDGSPEEKQVLRRRVIMESIAKRFMSRSFLVHVNHPDGTTHALGWDLGESLISAYHDGKLVVRGHQSDVRNAMINDNGDVVTLVDVDIMYVKETGESDDYGKPESVEVPFLEIRDNVIYLASDLKDLENASASMSGMFFKEIPFTGNPSDLKGIRDSIPDMLAMLNKAY